MFFDMKSDITPFTTPSAFIATISAFESDELKIKSRPKINRAKRLSFSFAKIISFIL